jgi:hypothetical protein
MAIIPLNQTYYEIIEAESPSKAIFNYNDSYAYITFLITEAQIFTFFQDVLGYAKLQNNSYIDRPKIPASHPLYPWLYAIGIQDIKGVSSNGRQDSVRLQNATAYAKVKTLKPPYTGSYKEYKITVRYQSREYAIYDNEQLLPFRQNNAKTYMPIIIPGQFAGDWTERQDNFINRAEYCRFTNWSWAPEVQYLTYGGGNFWMKRNEIREVGGVAEIPVSQEQNGTNYLRIARSKVNINWFMVPFEWAVNNEILLDSYSKINYEEFMFFPKGTLLFTELDVKKYDPQFPFLDINLTINSSVYDYYTEFYKNQYCDVTFKMVYMSYPDGTRVTTNPQLYAPLECKDVNSFHNRALGPSSRLWYYIDSKPAEPIVNQDGDQVGWAPSKAASPIYWNYNFKNLFNYREGA